MSEANIPARIGPYAVTQCLASRPFFKIFQGTNNAGKPIALKIGDYDHVKAEYAFLAEHQHPCFVRPEKGSCSIYNEDNSIFDEKDAVYGSQLGYFAMEYLDGRTLRDCLNNNDYVFAPVDPILVVNQMLAISRAMLPVWQQGLIHGDLNPNNIMCLFNGKWKLFDFHVGGVYKEGLTQDGATVGTMSYLPPAEFSRPFSQPTFQRDLYSLALTFYEAVSGDFTLFNVNDFFELITYKKHAPYRKLFCHPLIPSPLRKVLLDICCQWRWHKITTPQQFVDRLEQVQEELALRSPDFIGAK